jgi:hypothetical protein
MPGKKAVGQTFAHEDSQAALLRVNIPGKAGKGEAGN